MIRLIYCTGCEKGVKARLTDGAERYPHRADLKDIPFWHCDTCGAWVGTHWKTAQPTTPLGVLATPEILEYRKAIHSVIDPIWQGGKRKRGQVYAHMAKRLGYQYHTGEIRSLEQAKTILKLAVEYRTEVEANVW